MPLTIESLTAQLNQLQQQRIAAANMAQQCAGAISVVQKQIQELKKEQQEDDAKNKEESTEEESPEAEA